MKTRNFTLALPEDLIRELNIAAKRQTSISAVVTQALQQVVAESDEYDEAAKAMAADMKKG